jgi:hypothetical protein
MRLAVYLTLILVVIAAAAAADDGLALLKNELGARQTGMGAAFVSVGGDPNATAYNPALACDLRTFTATFGHVEFWENVRLESGYVGVGLTSRLYFHGGIRYAAVDELEWRERPTAVPDRLFDAHDVSFKAGLGYHITDRIDAGMAMGWFLEEIGGWRGSAFNLDLGVRMAVNEALHAGASVTNLGSSFELSQAGQLTSREISLPTAYRLGASYRYLDYLGAADVVILDDEFHLHLGAEGRFRDMFALRAGYMFGYDTKNFTAGASFGMRNVTVDYAFVPYTDGLGNTHHFNLTFSL